MTGRTTGWRTTGQDKGQRDGEEEKDELLPKSRPQGEAHTELKNTARSLGSKNKLN